MPQLGNARLVDCWKFGLWLSIPVSVIVFEAWVAGLSPTSLNLLFVAATLSFPWGPIGGIVIWPLVRFSVVSAFDLDWGLTSYWIFGVSAILGAHLNGVLLFSPRHLLNHPHTSRGLKKAQEP